MYFGKLVTTVNKLAAALGRIFIQIVDFLLVFVYHK
jgi:hypothetical protein